MKFGSAVFWNHKEMMYNETSLGGKTEVQQFSLQVILIENYLMSVGFLREHKKRQDLEEDILYCIVQTPTSLNVSATVKPSK